MDGSTDDDAMNQLERSPPALDLLRRLDRHGLLGGPIIGGCAYALLVGDWTDVRDIDVDVLAYGDSWTDGCGLEPDGWRPPDLISGATDKVTGLHVQFVGGAEFPNPTREDYEAGSVDGFSVMSPQDLVDRFAARGRHGKDGDRDCERAVRLIRRFGIDTRSIPWANERAVAGYFVEAIHGGGLDEEAWLQTARGIMESMRRDEFDEPDSARP
jgi:hypothetical protein